MSTNEILLNLWAKKKVVPPSEIRYPLLYHMLDVAMVAQELWRKSLLAGTNRFFAEQLGLPEKDSCSWISFWAGLHDIGKASPVFQRGSSEAKTLLESHGFPFDHYVDNFPHNEITSWVFPELMESVLPQNSVTKDLAQVVGITIGGHHGTFGNRIKGPGPRQKGMGDWSSIRSALVSELATLLNISSLPVPHYAKNNAFYIVLAGLTTVADWIGSDENFFSYEKNAHTPEQHLEFAILQAAKAVKYLGWAEWSPPIATGQFQKLFPFITQVRPLQNKVVELSKSLCNTPGLVIIEAPMGEGKTEAAMYLADCWATMLSQKGSYFALPTQATSNQMFGRVAHFLETRYPDSNTNLRLIHGNALLSDYPTTLYPQLSHDGDSADPYPEVTAGEWFLPKKRGLLSPFGVGTIDQSLLSVLQTRHFFVRLFGLAQKTVIIDEVHAYDTYMSTLLERLISWLRALGSSVILLSATLPARKREDLVKAYGGDPKSLKGTSYPRITWVSATDTQVVEFEAIRHVELQIRQIQDDTDSLVNQLRNNIKDGGCIAIICNTVKRAQETYVAIKQAELVSPDNLILLHSRYPFEKRGHTERDVLSAFGKNGKRPDCAILVATQIIEQSLDLDFDLMITDLAPVDLVIQRAGRVHRHNNPRPSSMSTPTLWIRMPHTDENGLPEFGNSANVYEPYFLLLSYLSLRECTFISLPNDIENLIDKVYGEPQCPWPSPVFKQAVLSAKTDMEAKMKGDEHKAQGNLVKAHDIGDPFDFFNAFNKQLEEDNPDIHNSLQALTRLVEATVQVVCLYKTPTGIFLHHGDRNPIDMSNTLDGTVVSSLLRRSMSITDKRIVFKLIKQQTPHAWEKCPALRHHRLLEFENGIARIDKYTLYLDEELGLYIEDSENY